MFSLYETNVREAYEFISAYTQTVSSFTPRVKFLTAGNTFYISVWAQVPC